MNLSVAIITHSPAGIQRIAHMQLPPIPSVEYVVSWQNHQDAPIPSEVASRPDIRICRFNSPGVSLNRNNAIANCHGDIILIGDDDLTYHPEALQEIIRIFHREPSLHYASFRFDGPDAKAYPPAECSINPSPRFFHQTAFEVAFRRSPATSRLRFSPYFGPGGESPFTCGEDPAFLLLAQRLGLNCRFFPLTIASHPTHTTGHRPITDPGVSRTKGALIALRHPIGVFPRIPLEAFREVRRGRARFLPALLHLTQGAIRLLLSPSIRRSFR